MFSPPVLKLENSKGISDEQLSKLKTDLDKMAIDLCGEVQTIYAFVLSVIIDWYLP